MHLFRGWRPGPLEGNMEQPKLTRRGFLVGTAATGAAAALALSGCGSSTSSSSASSASSAAAATGGAITAALANKMSNNNPIGMNGGSATGIAATWHVFESLYDLDVHDYTTYNALAADKPNVVDDTHYEVTLRDEAKFSDGTDVVAADVVKAFEACREDTNIGAFFSWLDTVEAKDDKTLSFTLAYPFATLFETRCALVKVVPSSQTEDELKTMPIGSGPWKYVSISNDDGGMIEFVPNEYYNGPDKYKATADTMSWNALQDPDARTTALTDGAALAINALPVANADLVNGVGASADFVPGFNQPFIMFNTKVAPFNDVRVRQAIHYAIDKDTLIKNIEDGHATAATSFLIKEMPNYHEASTVYTYDQDKAKSLLEEAGVTDLSFTLLTNTTFVKALVPQIVNDLAAVGITVTPDIQDMPWASVNEGQFEVILTGGDATCFGNDPDILMGWWYNDNLWMNGRTGWKETSEGLWDQLQDLMQQARETSDADAQQEAWNQCFDIIAENVPLYPLYHQDMVTGYYPEKLQGFEPISTTGLVFLGTTPVE